MNKFYSSILVIVISVVFARPTIGQMNNGSTLYELNWALTQTLIPDGVNPPLASRFYVYPNLAFHWAVASSDTKRLEYFKSVQRFPVLREIPEELPAELVAYKLFSAIVKEMVYRPSLFDTLTASLDSRLESKYPNVNHAKIEAAVGMLLPAILKWVDSDNYKLVRAMPEYTPNNKISSWVPTPPNYYDALEPNWSSMKGLMNIELSKLTYDVPVNFDTTVNTEFYNAVLHVYKTVKNHTQSQYLTAKYWDCNPLQTHVDGHHMISSQQMTPGGHWVGIAGITCAAENVSLQKAARVYSDISLGLYEGFRLAWSTKYKADLIRPETYINKYIDEEWRPLIETPPFPEYTSAHSVISMVSAQLLEWHFGTKYQLTDTMEVHFGLETRVFDGFVQAAEEVSVSRVYGGIHYDFAVEDGMKQGRELAEIMQRSLPSINE